MSACAAPAISHHRNRLLSGCRAVTPASTPVTSLSVCTVSTGAWPSVRTRTPSGPSVRIRPSHPVSGAANPVRLPIR